MDEIGALAPARWTKGERGPLQALKAQYDAVMRTGRWRTIMTSALGGLTLSFDRYRRWFHACKVSV